MKAPLDPRMLCSEAAVVYGPDAQLDMLQEECAELIAIVNRWRRRRCDREDVAQECADVEIMLMQMRVYLGDEVVDAAKREKLARLDERLAERRKKVVQP